MGGTNTTVPPTQTQGGHVAPPALDLPPPLVSIVVSNFLCLKRIFLVYHVQVPKCIRFHANLIKVFGNI